jgi:hypothetical protein
MHPTEFGDDVEISSLIGKVFSKFGIGTQDVE